MKTKPVTVGAIATEYVRLLFIYCIYGAETSHIPLHLIQLGFYARFRLYIFSIVQPKTFFFTGSDTPQNLSPEWGGGGLKGPQLRPFVRLLR